MLLFVSRHLNISHLLGVQQKYPHISEPLEAELEVAFSNPEHQCGSESMAKELGPNLAHG